MNTTNLTTRPCGKKPRQRTAHRKVRVYFRKIFLAVILFAALGLITTAIAVALGTIGRRLIRVWSAACIQRKREQP